MRRLSCLLLLMMLLSWPMFSQDRDSLLRRINQIKLDTHRYLYGLCTLPGEANPQLSLDEAEKELQLQVEAFLGTRKEIPSELTASVSCLLRPNTYRSIVYIEKVRLQEWEELQSRRLGSNARKEAVDILVSGILNAGTVNDVLDLIASSSLLDEIRTGQRIDNQSQQYANDGLLVFFDPRSKKVLEVMTPLDENYARKNAKTGAPANPMKYKNAPLWVYVEGLKNSLPL